MSDNETGVAEATPELDLADTIRAAINEDAASQTESAPEITDADGEQPRAPDGKFASKDGETAEIADADAEKPDDEAKQAEKSTESAADAEKPDAAETAPEATEDTTAPPPGWSIKSKQLFRALPAEIKADIAKREEEINNGFAKLQAFKGMEPYEQMARQSGKALPEVMEAYVAAEQYLQREPINGVKWLMAQYGVTLEQLGGQASAQPQAGTAEGNQTPPGVDLSPIVQEINALKTQFQTQQQRAEQAVTSDAQSQINAFKADPSHVYFENVREDMGALYQTGRAESLQDAYDQACWMNPEIRMDMISKQTEADNQKRLKEAEAVASKAKQAAKSVSGGAAGDTPSSPQNMDLRDMLREQMNSGDSRI